MGLPRINIIFTETASTFEARAATGVVALIIKDTIEAVQGSHVLTSVADIPADMTGSNKAYLERAFIGGTNKPSKLLCYVLPETAEDLSEATAWLSRQTFDWLAGPPDMTTAECTELSTWLTAQRTNGRRYKAVLPDTAANKWYIVNFTSDGIKAGSETFTTAQFCSRIAGLLAGTDLSGSVTYAVLPEVTGIAELSREDLNKAIDAGEMVLFSDGRSVKVGRGVTSLTTPAVGDCSDYKKVKVVETVDRISGDLDEILSSSYIGRYANSYDSRLVLMTAIKGYFLTLEATGVLRAGSTVDIDMEAVTAWLKSHGVDTSEMTEQQIRESDTGEEVFLAANIKIYGALEDINLKILI